MEHRSRSKRSAISTRKKAVEEFAEIAAFLKGHGKTVDALVLAKYYNQAPDAFVFVPPPKEWVGGAKLIDYNLNPIKIDRIKWKVVLEGVENEYGTKAIILKGRLLPITVIDGVIRLNWKRDDDEDIRFVIENCQGCPIRLDELLQYLRANLGRSYLVSETYFV